MERKTVMCIIKLTAKRSYNNLLYATDKEMKDPMQQNWLHCASTCLLGSHDKALPRVGQQQSQLHAYLSLVQFVTKHTDGKHQHGIDSGADGALVRAERIVANFC